jgi:hypothetical protein
MELHASHFSVGCINNSGQVIEVSALLEDGKIHFLDDKSSQGRILTPALL